jgi:hypothetical protein
MGPRVRTVIGDYQIELEKGTCCAVFIKNSKRLLTPLLMSTLQILPHRNQEERVCLWSLWSLRAFACVHVDESVWHEACVSSLRPRLRLSVAQYRKSRL